MKFTNPWEGSDFMQADVTWLAALVAGVISFISPCVLPLIPAYISYISGVSLEELQEDTDRRRILKKVVVHSFAFIVGFSVVFIALGASASALGQFLFSRLAVLAKVAGLAIILFGLHTAGVFRIAFLNYEKRFQTRGRPMSVLGSLTVGLAFAFGWTPCIGPILAGILALAGTKETVAQGIALLSWYSAGLAIPFFVTSVSINSFFGVFRWLKKHFRAVEVASGVFLVAVGLMIFFNVFTYLSALFLRWFPWLTKIG